MKKLKGIKLDLIYTNVNKKMSIGLFPEYILSSSTRFPEKLKEIVKKFRRIKDDDEKQCMFVTFDLFKNRAELQFTDREGSTQYITIDSFGDRGFLYKEAFDFVTVYTRIRLRSETLEKIAKPISIKSVMFYRDWRFHS